MRALDLCAGAGGLSLGLQRAGFDVLGIELDADAIETHRRHVGPCEAADLRTYHPEPVFDLVAGGVPCQPFSAAGLGLGLDDPRYLVPDFLRIAREAGSRAVLLENVRGLVLKPKAFRAVLDAFEAEWLTTWTVVDAADYGNVALCPKHACYAGSLSVPTIVLDTVEHILRGVGLTPTERAALAKVGLERITDLVCADVATLAKLEADLDHRRAVKTTGIGRVDASRTSADMCACGWTGGIEESTGSLRRPCSSGRSCPPRSCITKTNNLTTTGQKTCGCSHPTETTCENILKAEVEIQNCDGCQWYATPQHRDRLFVVGFKSAEDRARFRWPEPTHAPPGGLFGRPYRTVREALSLGDAPHRKGPKENAKPGQLQGMRLLDVDAPAYTVGGHSFDLLDRPAPCVTATEQKLAMSGSQPMSRRRRASERLSEALGALDRPSPVITAGGTESGGGAEPIANREQRRELHDAIEAAGLADRPATTVQGDPRLAVAGHHDRQQNGAVRLSVEQCALLQGFPPGWTWTGNKSSRHRQIGNAVPPALAEAMGRAVRRALGGGA